MSGLHPHGTTDLRSIADPMERMFRSFPALPFQIEEEAVSHERRESTTSTASVTADSVLTMIAAMRATNLPQ